MIGKAVAGLQADGGDLGHVCGRPGMARVDVVLSGHGGRDGAGGPLCRAIGQLVGLGTGVI